MTVQRSPYSAAMRAALATRLRHIADKGSGLEAWRSFFHEYEPQVQNRYGGLFAQILSTKFKGLSVDELDRWETLIREYETTADKKGVLVTVFAFRDVLDQDTAADFCDKLVHIA